jgi:hypothetical protein
MDNKGIKSPVPTMVMENETTVYELDEMQVDGFVRVLFYHPENYIVNVTIHRFIGDRSGQVHIRSKQIIYIEYVESETNVTEAPVSYIIDQGAEVVFPTEVHMQGINTTLNGLIVGVHHLYIEDGCTLTVLSEATTAQLQDEEYIDVTKPGQFELPTINIRMDGILEFRKILSDITIGAAFLELKYGGLVLMNHGYVVAGDVDLESNSKFSLEGKGFKAEDGPGKGIGNMGGSYGGVGGGANDYKAYGSVFDPMNLGSGGGGIATGGSGGGFVNFTIGKSFHIDGIVDAYGQDASSNGGGGSGGTIFIKAYNMSGYGTLDVSGGDGSGTGYGGSGGRIAAHIESFNLYAGKYLSHGGKSGKNDAQNAGGPGTIYKFESNRGPQYRELKYNPRLNRTLIEPEHRKLTVENFNLKTTNPAVVMETDSMYYEFEEVQVEGYSYVHFYHPRTVHVVQVKIHELTGNKQGMIRVQNNQQLMIHYVESTHTYLDTPCGFHVDKDGEIILPSTVVMLTKKTILGGTMINVEELIIERNAEFVIDNDASTLAVTDFKFGILQTPTPGIFDVAIISINYKGLFTTNMNPYHVTIMSGLLTVRNGGKLATNTQRVTLETADLDVEYGGLIDGTGQGYGKATGPGKGVTSSHDASGGGLASKGIMLFSFFNPIIKFLTSRKLYDA